MRIALNPRQAIEKYTYAAWCFAASILWPQLAEDDEAAQSALRYLEHYFLAEIDDLEEAFITFCEHVVTAEAMSHYVALSKPKRIWAALVHPKGLLALGEPLITPRLIRGMKRRHGVRRGVIAVVAMYYFWYMNRPSTATIQKLNDELALIGASDAMNIFYKATLRRAYFDAKCMHPDRSLTG